MDGEWEMVFCRMSILFPDLRARLPVYKPRGLNFPGIAGWEFGGHSQTFLRGLETQIVLN